jgi:DNA (cytosine-5)-methyltransferase 1
MTASDDRPLIVGPPDAFYVRGFTPRHGESMVHPISKPLGALTANDTTSLLVPYYGKGRASSVQAPVPTVTTHDRFGLLEAGISLDDCLFRMLEPHEVDRAMAFPEGYRVDGDKRTKVRLYGNAVTPPVMRWIVARIASALGTA